MNEPMNETVSSQENMNLLTQPFQNSSTSELEKEKKRILLKKVDTFYKFMLRMIYLISGLTLFFSIVNYNQLYTVITGLFILMCLIVLAQVSKKQKDLLVDLVIMDALKK